MIAALAATLLALQEADPASLPELRKRVTIEKTGTAFELLDELRRLCGANLVVDPDLARRIDPRARIELSLRDVAADSALRWICRVGFRGARASLRDNVVRLSHERPDPVLRSHDARGVPPLTLRDKPGGRLAIPREDMFGFTYTTDEPRESSVGEEHLIDLLKETASPGTFEGLATIERGLDGHLAVSQRPSVHDEVAWILDRLRENRPAAISLGADLVELDDAAAALLEPGASARVAAADLDAALRRFRGPRTRTFALSGSDGQRVHLEQRQETEAVVDFSKDGPFLGRWISRIEVLDARSSLVAGGRFVEVELRLSLGQSRDLAAEPTPLGELPRHELTATELGTTLLVPAGGAAVLALPSNGAGGAPPQLLLLRASVDPARAAPPPARVHPAADPPEIRTLRDRLARAPATDVDFADAPLSDVVRWLRKTLDANVVLLHLGAEPRVTLRLRQVPPARILELALEQADCGLGEQDEALVIGPPEDLRPAPRLLVLPANDVAFGPCDFPRRDHEHRQQFTGEDLANLIQNSIRKNRWEEADGCSIQLARTALFVRNHGDVLDEVRRFVAERRAVGRRSLAIRADLALVPASTADAVLDKGEVCLLDRAQAEALVASGSVLERLGWQALDEQRTTLHWDRARNFVGTYGEDGDPATEIAVTRSWLSLRGTIGDGVAVELDFQDERLLGTNERKFGKLACKVPVPSAARAATTFELPKGKVAALRWTIPPEPGVERRYRILLLRAEALPEVK
jgi:hypothetical protein